MTMPGSVEYIPIILGPDGSESMGSGDQEQTVNVSRDVMEM